MGPASHHAVGHVLSCDHRFDQLLRVDGSSEAGLERSGGDDVFSLAPIGNVVPHGNSWKKTDTIGIIIMVFSGIFNCIE